MSADPRVTIRKCRIFALLIIYISSVTAVGLLVYFFAGRPAYSSIQSCSKRPSSHHNANGIYTKPVQNIRLPRNVLPWHYDVRLLPVLKRGNFTVLGHVSIQVECQNATDRIVLHSAEIDVDRYSVQVWHISRLPLEIGHVELF